MTSDSKPFVLENCISVKSASEYSGYSQQYLRRLLRAGRLSGIKIGQVWLIDKFVLDAYIENSKNVKDLRFGSKKYSCASDS